MTLSIDQIITVIIAFAAPLLLAGANQLFSLGNHRSQRRREMIASANKSVLKRVELCYRIQRRIHEDVEDIKTIRNMAHEVQEENEYYRGLLLSESRWFGERYSLYIGSIRKLTANSMKKAWEAKGDPSTRADSKIKLNHSDIGRLSDQFMKDFRRFMNPFLRCWMRTHDFMLRRFNKKVSVYDSR